MFFEGSPRALYSTEHCSTEALTNLYLQSVHTQPSAAIFLIIFQNRRKAAQKQVDRRRASFDTRRSGKDGWISNHPFPSEKE
jgi:hypothetical protein